MSRRTGQQISGNETKGCSCREKMSSTSRSRKQSSLCSCRQTHIKDTASGSRGNPKFKGKKVRIVLVQKYIRANDQQKPLPKISILDAMDILAASWSMVSEKTTVNCFAKAGLSSENQHQAASDEDDPFKDLVEELTKLQNRDQEIDPANTSAETLLTATSKS